MNDLKAISLFSSSGIGDLGLHANGINTVVACELLEERMNLFRSNNPETKCFCGDIWELQSDIVEYYKDTYDEAPFIILATPPCQGMSPNGMGKMLNDYRKGLFLSMVCPFSALSAGSAPIASLKVTHFSVNNVSSAE